MPAFFSRTIKIGTAATPGTEPSYTVTISDPLKPIFELNVDPITYETAAGERTKGYGGTFSIECGDVFGNSAVDALVDTNVWIHAEPDGTIGSGNPAVQIKDFMLMKGMKLTGSISGDTKVTYKGKKEAATEAAIWAKDITA